MTQVNISAAEKAAHDKIMGSGMKVKKTKKAWSRKDTSLTFWNKLRIENNYTLEVLADVLKVRRPALCMYLTGQSMPSDTFINNIADLFGVNRKDARTQFQIGFDVWHNTHGKTVKVAPRKSNPVIEDKLKTYTPKTQKKPEAKAEIKPNKVGITVKDILKELHPVLTWDKYADLVIATYNNTSVDWDNILDIVFKKGDRALYDRVKQMADA